MDKTLEIISFFLNNQSNNSFFDILKFLSIVKNKKPDINIVSSKLELLQKISNNDNFSISFCKKRYVKSNYNQYKILQDKEINQLTDLIKLFNIEPDFKYLKIG